MKKLFVGIDRDGTIIEKVHFLGKEENWKEKLVLKKMVVCFLKYLQAAFESTFVVFSNQGGVARRLFSRENVEEINNRIDSLLRRENIKIQNWQYCPYADQWFFEQHRDAYDWNENYVVEESKRKPKPEMFYDALQAMRKTRDAFDGIVMIGDSEDDRLFAENIGAIFVDVRGKSCSELIKSLKMGRG